MAAVRWLDERYPFTKAIEEAMYQRVPNFANAFYYCFGGLVFVIIVLQLPTGILPAVYYVPDPRRNPAPPYPRLNFIQTTPYPAPPIRAVLSRRANTLFPIFL